MKIIIQAITVVLLWLLFFQPQSFARESILRCMNTNLKFSIVNTHTATVSLNKETKKLALLQLKKQFPHTYLDIVHHVRIFLVYSFLARRMFERKHHRQAMQFLLLAKQANDNLLELLFHHCNWRKI